MPTKSVKKSAAPKKAIMVATVAGHLKTFHEPYLELLQSLGYETLCAAKDTLREKGQKLNHCDQFFDLLFSRSRERATV